MPRNFGSRCGTVNGYSDHRRVNETPCQACRDAAAEYSRERRAARRNAGSIRGARRAATVTATGRRFGVELEFTGDRYAVRAEMIARGLACEIESYNHHVRSAWKIVTDSSCGYELVSPPLRGVEGLREVELATEAMNAAGVGRGPRCGTHVHVEAADLTLESAKRIAVNYSNAQDVINGIVTSSRRSNGMCRPLSPHAIAEFDRAGATLQSVASRWNRYQVVNFASFARYGTVEFRQHHATSRGARLTNWVALVASIVDFAVAGGALPAGVSSDLFFAAAADRGLRPEARASLETVRAA